MINAKLSKVVGSLISMIMGVKLGSLCNTEEQVGP